MTGSCERVFYGRQEGLNLRSPWDFLRRGFDSSIVAPVYDREDVDYTHFTGSSTK